MRCSRTNDLPDIRSRFAETRGLVAPVLFLQHLMLLALTAMLFLAQGCQPRLLTTGVVEEDSMTRVLKEVDAETLVVFDIDNTLLEPVAQLGSDQWFYYLIDVGVRRGMTREQASSWADGVFNDTQVRLSMRCVDSKAPHVLAELRRRGIRYFALTARSAGIHEVTLRQLDAVGLDLAAGGFAPGAAAAPGAAGKGSLFNRGVFFIGESGPTKGEALVRILKAAGCRPARIVFVDDKEKHVRSVKAALTQEAIPHLCLRFARTDAKVAALSGELKDAALLLNGP